MAKLKSNLTTVIAVTTALSLASYAMPASAGGKKGPRASVAALTTCAVNGTSLDVTVNVTDKTSGDAIAVIDAYSITPVYKSLSQKGNQTMQIDGLVDSSDTNVPVNSGVTISKSYQLCDVLADIPTDLRAVGADVSVTYGKDDGAGGVADTRTIINSCSDDPATEEDEQATLKINYDELATACAAP